MYKTQLSVILAAGANVGRNKHKYTYKMPCIKSYKRKAQEKLSPKIILTTPVSMNELNLCSKQMETQPMAYFMVHCLALASYFALSVL